MGVYKIKAQKFECDDPTCKSILIVEDITDAIGFHGHVFRVTNFGGNAADWYACTEEHIPTAIQEALRKAWDND